MEHSRLEPALIWAVCVVGYATAPALNFTFQKHFYCGSHCVSTKQHWSRTFQTLPLQENCSPLSLILTTCEFALSLHLTSDLKLFHLWLHYHYLILLISFKILKFSPSIPKQESYWFLISQLHSLYQFVFKDFLFVRKCGKTHTVGSPNSQETSHCS